MSTRLTADDILLHDIEHACQQLQMCLQQEFEALNQRQYATLISISQPKQLLITTLSALDQQVHTNKNIQQHPHWHAIRQFLQLCQQQNARNGKLLNRSYQLSQETLNILTGRGKTSDTTYTATGIKQTTTASISDVSA